MNTNITNFEVVVKPRKVTKGDYKGFELKQGMITFTSKRKIVNVIDFDSAEKVITVFAPAKENFAQQSISVDSLQDIKNKSARELYERSLKAKEQFTRGLELEKEFTKICEEHEFTSTLDSTQERAFITLVKQHAEALGQELNIDNISRALAMEFEEVALNAMDIALEERALIVRTIEIPDLRATKYFKNIGAGKLRRRFVPTPVIGVFESYLVQDGEKFKTSNPIYMAHYTIITKQMHKELEQIDKDIYL